MHKLKDGYELLANLLMHEYSCYHGFALAEFSIKKSAISSDPSSEMSKDSSPEKNKIKLKDREELDDVVLKSRQQLRALQRLKEEREKETTEDGEGDGEGEQRGNIDEVKQGETGGSRSRTAPTGQGTSKDVGDDDSKLGSLSCYDTLLIDLLTHLSAPDVRET